MNPSIKGAPRTLLAPMTQYIEARAPLVSMIKYIEARAPLVSMIRYMEGAPGAYDSLYRGEGAPGAYDSLHAGRSSMMSEMRVQAGALHPLPLGTGCWRMQKRPFLTRAKKE